MPSKKGKSFTIIIIILVYIVLSVELVLYIVCLKVSNCGVILLFPFCVNVFPLWFNPFGIIRTALRYDILGNKPCWNARECSCNSCGNSTRNSLDLDSNTCNNSLGNWVGNWVGNCLGNWGPLPCGNSSGSCKLICPQYRKWYFRVR